MRSFKVFSNTPTFEDDIPDGYEYAGVSLTYYSPYSFIPSKYILMRNLEDNVVVRGKEIYFGHPLFDLEDRTEHENI